MFENSQKCLISVFLKTKNSKKEDFNFENEEFLVVFMTL